MISSFSCRWYVNCIEFLVLMTRIQSWNLSLLFNSVSTDLVKLFLFPTEMLKLWRFPFFSSKCILLPVKHRFLFLDLSDFWREDIPFQFNPLPVNCAKIIWLVILVGYFPSSDIRSPLPSLTVASGGWQQRLFAVPLSFTFKLWTPVCSGYMHCFIWQITFASVTDA